MDQKSARLCLLAPAQIITDQEISKIIKLLFLRISTSRFPLIPLIKVLCHQFQTQISLLEMLATPKSSLVVGH
jgi:hypothetical protein